MNKLKSNSSKWARKMYSDFAWQDGYSGFSYSHSQRNDVIRYIRNQKQHHQTMSYLDELKQLLTKFDISFDDDMLV